MLRINTAFGPYHTGDVLCMECRRYHQPPICAPTPQPDPVQAVREAWAEYQRHRKVYAGHSLHVYCKLSSTGICTCHADELTAALDGLTTRP